MTLRHAALTGALAGALVAISASCARSTEPPAGSAAAPASGLPAVPSTPRAGSDVAFPPEVYAGRRARLREQIGPDAALVLPGRYLVGAHDLPRQDPNFWYLTGVESPYAVLVMSPGAGGGATLFLPGRFQFAGAQYPLVDERLRRAAWNRPVRRLFPGPDAAAATGIADVRPVDEFADAFATLLAGAKALYVPAEDPLYAPPGLAPPQSVEQQFVRAVVERAGGVRVENVAPLVRSMRLIKDEHEIAALRRAAAISSQGMTALMRAVRPGMNDMEAAGVMELEWKRLGSPRASFAPIVGSGPHAMTFFTLMGETYNAVDRVMQAGELIFVDYGAAEVLTYASDLCRTLPVSGRFTDEQRRYYDIVLEAQEAAIAALGPGVMMIDAVKAAAQVFRRHGLEKYEDVGSMGEDRVWGVMPSPTHYLARNAGIVRYTPYGAGVRDLGHHIGLEVQDSRDYSRPLAPGMVVTIEPKIYIPDRQIAIMIEDMILVTPSGVENLSATAPKQAAEIERIMAAGRRGAGDGRN
jgi:Xaa-Pro aminopeptidase